MGDTPDLPGLVEVVKAALGAKTDQDLSYELRRRYGVRVGQPTINKWRNGKNLPRYNTTMALLDAAGWLSPDRTGMAAAEALAAEAERKAGPLKNPSKPSAPSKRTRAQ